MTTSEHNEKFLVMTDIQKHDDTKHHILENKIRKAGYIT